MGYGASILNWNKNKLQKVGRKRRKIMTINKKVHPRSDVASIYASKMSGRKGLHSCESCVRGEENRLNGYIKYSKEILLRKVS